ncbi:hypothetical protein [Actinophytocola xanthii]|uniref:Uncharacterized protein n=1 Tax=Actinophytocola xanthii TaxID=1912961 RepID=A0A1Q8CSQ9_9PSEU|nr:hypothetical protein [Actinophytocola xanthii]OLF17383.1 hypothetical protein BU204_12305 [Actinophytocola xanthii]
MARERVDSFSEAKELYREHRPRTVAYVAPDIRAGELPVHGVNGTNMDGIAADFDALVTAERELAQLHDDLFAQLREANSLSGPLGDGSSPVTGPMRKAFLDRADVDGGVQAALVDYIEELFDVRSAILQTLSTYQGVDGDAAARLNRQMEQLDREVGDA